MKLFGSVVALVHLVALVLTRLVLANLQLAADILRPRPRFEPGFLEYTAQDLTPNELVTLATIISLTPGSLTVDLDKELKRLLIHSLYTRDEADLRAKIDDFAELLKRGRIRGRIK